MFLRKALVLVCGFSLLAVAGWSQAPTSGAAMGAAVVSTDGTKVHGTITDPDGELIPGATITLTPAHGGAIKATSGSDGTYSVTVAPGTYGLRVSMNGFASYSMVNLRIPAVASTTVDAKLKIGEQTQVVNVNANTIQLSVDPDSNADATVITGKDLNALSDDPDELSSELTAMAGPSAGPNGGQIYVDGFTGGQLPPKSSIREIRINQNPFSAEYDKLGYGRVEVFTKPGTNTLHGNFQINGNPSQFNASNPLTSGYQPPYHTVFMFGNLTGPLSKNASYNIGGTYRQIEDDEFTNATLLAAGVTAATDCVQTVAGAATVNPACEQTYQTSTYYPQTRVDINPRLDLALGQKNVLTMRYQYVNNTSTNAGIGNLTLPMAGYNTSTLSNILQMSDTQTFSPRLISETRFEYEREHVATTALNNSPSINVEGAFQSGGYSAQDLTDHQDHIEVQSYNSLQLKKNFVRFGGRLRTEREAQDTENNTNGSFLYSNLINTPTTCTTAPCTTAPDNSYQTGSPSQFTITKINNHDIGDTYADLGMYLETDWKARQNLTVSYGFRYETQNHLSDHHDIAPRVEASYGLNGKKGSPKTVLHGGFGLFYDRFAQSNILTLEQENGTNEQVSTVSNPGTTCSPTAIAACEGLVSPASQTTYSAAPNLRTPYIVEFAGGADQQVGLYGKLSINLLHSQGVHELATQNLNYNYDPAAPGPATASKGPEYQYFTEGVFNQNELILNGRVQTTRWLSLFGYYALNSAHGDTSGAGAFISTPGHIAADYGRTTFDQKNRIFMAGSISLPKFIQFSPFIIGQSGNPYNVTTGSDNNNDTIFNDRPDIVTGVAPNASGTIKSIPGCGTFAQPGAVAGATTIAPINDCTGPALFTMNFRLTKTFGFGPLIVLANGGSPGGAGGDHDHGDHGGHHGGPGGGPFGNVSTGKRYNLAFGLQVMNLFDNEDLSTPQGALSSPEFGQSTQLAGGPYSTNSALRRITLQTSFNF